MRREPALTLTRDGAVATLVLDRAGGNRIDDEMMSQLAEGVELLSADADVALLVLRGAGDDFSLGRERPPRDHVRTPEKVRQDIAGITRANEALALFPGMSLAIVQGRALGFAAALVSRCDLAIAAERSRFGFPEILGGTPPAIVISHVSRALPRKAAVDMVLTAREVGAAEALAIGLVSRVVPDAELEAMARTLIDELVAKGTVALRAAKEMFRRAGPVASDSLSEDAAMSFVGLLASQRPASAEPSSRQ